MVPLRSEGRQRRACGTEVNIEVDRPDAAALVARRHNSLRRQVMDRSTVRLDRAWRLVRLCVRASVRCRLSRARRTPAAGAPGGGGSLAQNHAGRLIWQNMSVY